jgi:hypothetical protein
MNSQAIILSNRLIAQSRYIYCMKKFLLLLSFFFLIAGIGSCKKNACKSVNCNGGGNCVEGTCQCDSLHEGTNCGIEKRARYFRSSVGQIVCPSKSRLDYVTITAKGTPADTLNFRNLFGEEQNIFGLIQNDGSVYIPSQYSNTNLISGTASLVNNKLVVNFTVNNAGTVESCSWTEQW